MTSDNLPQLLYKGFHITLGATAALVENLQDPQQRSQQLSQMQLELDRLTTEWEAKGESTEQEARHFVQQILERLPHQQSSSTAPFPAEQNSSTPAPTVPPDVQLEIQELTAQLAAIRAELKQMQERDPDIT